jgi:cytochrome c oxidase subunit 4
MMPETHDHVVSPRLYLIVLVALMLLLLLTLVAAFIDLDKQLHGSYWNMSLAIIIAMLKAVLIILFFMHVKYAGPLTWAFASAAFVWLAILLTLTFTDYGTRTYQNTSSASTRRLTSGRADVSGFHTPVHLPPSQR